jgi:hypothetical protein
MMDFLDPKKSRAHEIRLRVGYVLTAVAIVLATVVLLYQAYGFGVKQGKVVQNGLVFVSSTPSSADIYINGQRKDATNSRLTLPSGTYALKLSRSGYHDWQRALTVEGGGLEHVDYPFLIPNSLASRDVTAYSAAPSLATQSPDRRWVLVQQPGSMTNFDMYDVKDPKKTDSAKTSFSLPANVLTASDGAQALTAVEWSNDNIHVVLRHDYDDKSEYILVSRKAPEESVNLTQKLALVSTEIPSLQDKKYDQYFVHDSATQTLYTASLDKPGLQSYLTNVVAYKSYGSSTILYVARQLDAKGAPKASGLMDVKVYQDKKNYAIRSIAEAPTYLLGLSQYSGSWYVTAANAAENRVYIYKDPVGQLQRAANEPLVPVNILKLTAPTYVAISANSQMVAAENGNNFAVYDIENDRTHSFTLDKALDPPQVHATWMDGNRLTYVSGGQSVLFDYDGTNQQTLVAADPAQGAFFDTGYTSVYALSPTKAANGVTPPAGQYSFTATWLRTKEDQ